MKKRSSISPVGLVLLILGMVCSLSNVFIFRSEHGFNLVLLVTGLVFVIAGCIIVRRAAIRKRKEGEDN